MTRARCRNEGKLRKRRELGDENRNGVKKGEMQRQRNGVGPGQKEGVKDK